MAHIEYSSVSSNGTRTHHVNGVTTVSVDAVKGVVVQIIKIKNEKLGICFGKVQVQEWKPHVGYVLKQKAVFETIAEASRYGLGLIRELRA